MSRKLMLLLALPMAALGTSALLFATALAPTTASAASGLHACGSLKEHGNYVVQIYERHVACHQARGLYDTWKQQLISHRIPASVLDTRPYGRFGLRYRLGKFDCRFAATGLAGGEYKLICHATQARTIKIIRA